MTVGYYQRHHPQDASGTDVHNPALTSVFMGSANGSTVLSRDMPEFVDRVLDVANCISMKW